MNLDAFIAELGIEQARAFVAEADTAMKRLWSRDPRLSNERCTGSVAPTLPIRCAAAATVEALPVPPIPRLGEDGSSTTTVAPSALPPTALPRSRGRKPKLNGKANGSSHGSPNGHSNGHAPDGPAGSGEAPSSPATPSIPVEQPVVTTNPFDVQALLAEGWPQVVRMLLDKAINGQSIPAARVLAQIAPLPKSPLFRGALADPAAPFDGDAEQASLRILWLANLGIIDAGQAAELLATLKLRTDMLREQSIELRLTALEADEPFEAGGYVETDPRKCWPFVDD